MDGRRAAVNAWQAVCSPIEDIEITSFPCFHMSEVGMNVPEREVWRSAPHTDH